MQKLHNIYLLIILLYIYSPIIPLSCQMPYIACCVYVPFLDFFLILLASQCLALSIHFGDAKASLFPCESVQPSELENLTSWQGWRACVHDPEQNAIVSALQ